MERRTFLRGLGGITVALPMLGVFGASRVGSAQTAGSAPRRMIVMAYPMGTNVPDWQPRTSGGAMTLPAITSPLAGLEGRCLFISNCDNSIHELVTSHQFGHPGKEQTALTGTLTLDALAGGRNEVSAVQSGGGAEGGAGGPSIEEVVARHLRRPAHRSTAIGLAVNGEPDRRRELVDSLFFHEAAGTPVTLQADVGRAFSSLFGGVGMPGDTVDPAIARLHERNRSVLDAVRESFTDLRQGLGAADRLVLDEHAARIRRLELDVMRVTCSPPSGLEGAPRLSMSDLAPLQNRIAAAALGCDLAPVARIEFVEQQNPRFGIPAVDEFVLGYTDWHDLVHRHGESLSGRVQGFRYFVDMYAHLLRELESIPDGAEGGTLLDSTLVMLATNFGPGNGHSAKKMCTLLAGNLGGARTGFHYDAAPGAGFYTDSAYGMNHVHNSILQMVGVTNADGSPMTTHGLRGFADGQVISEIFS